MTTKIGDRFGRLVVIAAAEPAPNYLKRWKCKCTCKNIVTVLQAALRNGQTKSCGCLQRERTSAAAKKSNTIHGESANSLGGTTPEYRCWSSMIQRCHSKNNRNYKRYGARGIFVCDEWRKSYPNFLAHIGRRPSPKHSLDRIDNNKGYEPGNVRWASQKQQNNNKNNNVFITCGGISKTVAEWSAGLDVPYARLYSRVDSGWDPEDVIKLRKLTPKKGNPVRGRHERIQGKSGKS